jgi:TolB protein
MPRLSWVNRTVAMLIALGGLSLLPGCFCQLCHNHDSDSTEPAPSTTSPTHAAAGAGHEPVVQFGQTISGDGISPSAGDVNLFGEMKGVRVSQVRPNGEANFQQHTFVEQGYDADVAVDATGKFIVFASTRDNEHTNLFLQRTDGAAVVQLTAGTADDANPSFSPDGRQIAFSSTRAGNWQIFLMTVDGKSVTQVTTDTMQAIHPTWSPDGNRLAYCALGSKSGQWELWTINLQSNEKRMIGYGLFPNWSPSRDIDRIAFQRPRQRGSRWFSLWSLDLIDGEATHVTEVVLSSNAAVVSPSWSPDGTRLAFATVMDPNKELPPHSRGRTDIWIVKADGTERQRITDGIGINLTPCWAADNRIFFVSDRGGAECVWSARGEPNRVFTADAKKEPARQQAADAKDPGGPN